MSALPSWKSAEISLSVCEIGLFPQIFSDFLKPLSLNPHLRHLLLFWGGPIKSHFSAIFVRFNFGQKRLNALLGASAMTRKYLDNKICTSDLIVEKFLAWPPLQSLAVKKNFFFVQILGGEKLLKFGEKWAVKNF